ncbi:MAG: hypothetical protein WAP03_19240 [Methylorubrum rhodinum]|uniref:hypothetical protein n=1 Tax=Methylorubrum rhodinum TaxID=29428 RepID=UPI003BB21C5F
MMSFEDYCTRCLALQLDYIAEQRTKMRDLEAVRMQHGLDRMVYKAEAHFRGFHALTGPEIAARLAELDAMERDAPRAFGDTPGMRALYWLQVERAA